QYQAAVDQVERALWQPGRVGIGHLELDVAQVSALRLPARLLNLVTRDVDRHDRPARRNLLGNPAGNIAAAATDLDDALTVAQADRGRQCLGARSVDLVQQA